MGSLSSRPTTDLSLPYLVLQSIANAGDLLLERKNGKYELTFWKEDGSYIETKAEELCDCLIELRRKVIKNDQ